MLLVDLKDNGSPGDSQKRGKPGPLGPPGEIMSQPVFVVEGKSYSRASSFLGCSAWCMIILIMVPLNITFQLFAAGEGANPGRKGEREHSEGARQQYVCTLVHHNHYSFLLSSQDSPEQNNLLPFVI